MGLEYGNEKFYGHIKGYGNENRTFDSGPRLFAIEIQILFLKLTIALNFKR